MSTGRWGWTRLLLALLVVSSLSVNCGGADDFDTDDTIGPGGPTTVVEDPAASTTEPPILDPRLNQAVAGATADVVEGQITHDVPGEMIEGETYSVLVRVGSQGSLEEFNEAVERAGAVLTEEEEGNVEDLPRIGAEMVVRLVTPPSFKRTDENSQQQSLGEEGLARWGYQLQPTEPGEHEIRITAEIVVGESVQALEPVYDGTITVAVADKPLLEDISSRIDPLVGFLLLIATVASGIGGLIAIREYADRRRADRQAREPVGPVDQQRQPPTDSEDRSGPAPPR